MTSITFRRYNMKSTNSTTRSDELHHSEFDADYSMATTNERSANIGIKPTTHRDNVLSYYDEESRSSKCMYDSATWRMYNRIMNARKSRIAVVPAMQCSTMGPDHRTCRSTMIHTSDSQELFPRSNNSYYTGNLSSSDSYSSDSQAESDSDSEYDYTGVFSIDI